MKIITSIAIGGILAFLCIATGFFMLGMGHGPQLFLEYATLTIALYPLAILHYRGFGQNISWKADVLAIWLSAAAMVVLPLFWFAAFFPDPHLFMPTGWILVALVAAAIALASWFFKSRGHSLLGGDVVLVIAAVLLDIMLVQEVAASFSPVPPLWLLLIWLLFWGGWQVLALLALNRHRKMQAAAI